MARRAIIFDFDGLILPREIVEINIWQSLYAKAGIPFNKEDYISHVGSSGDHLYGRAATLADAMGNGTSSEQIYEEVLISTANELMHTDALPGVEWVVRAAKDRGIYLAIGSSSPAVWIKPHLERLGLMSCFDTIVSMDDVTQAKPSPEIFLRALQRLAVEPANALVLEDSANGVIAATRAGIRVVVVPSTVTQNQDFHLAYKVLPSLLDLEIDQVFDISPITE